jgi:hypothetical protein
VILAVAALLAQVGFPLFSNDFPPEEFAKRRAAVFDAIGTKAVAVLQGAPTPVGYTRFRQSTDFYYLSGVEVPNAYLLLDPVERRTTLYLPHRNERPFERERKPLRHERAEPRGERGSRGGRPGVWFGERFHSAGNANPTRSGAGPRLFRLCQRLPDVAAVILGQAGKLGLDRTEQLANALCGAAPP